MVFFEDTHQTWNHLRATGPPRQRGSHVCVRVCVCVCLGEVLQAVNPLACPAVSASCSTVSASACGSGSLDLPPHWSCLLILFMFAAAALSLTRSPAPALTLSPYRAATRFSPTRPTYRLLNFQLFFFLLLLALLCLFTPLSSDSWRLTWQRVSLNFWPGLISDLFIFWPPDLVSLPGSDANKFFETAN